MVCRLVGGERKRNERLTDSVEIGKERGSVSCDVSEDACRLRTCHLNLNFHNNSCLYFKKLKIKLV